MLNDQPSPSWLHIAITMLASFLTGGSIVKLYNIYVNRKKTLADTHVSEARATEITVRSSSVAGDALIRMMDRLDKAQINLDRLRQEVGELELKLDLQTIELQNERMQRERACNLLALHGIPYSEADVHRH